MALATNNTLHSDAAFLQRTLDLAAKAEGNVAPNPMVGCVIVGPDGQILSEGYHQAYGGPHAEIEALQAMPAGSSLAGATVYISLEPCAHYGNTAPCADALLAAEPARVVAAMADPNPLVAGKGFAKLKAAGIQVQEGPLGPEARIQNRRFISWHTHKRPFITLKWAQTADGFLAKADFSSKWITGEKARSWVHHARGKHMGIAVGYNTALHDNPTLDTRLWPGPNPVRLVADPLGTLPFDLKLFTDKGPTLHLVQYLLESESGPGAPSGYKQVLWPEGATAPEAIVQAAYAAGLQSILIEGGAATLRLFIEKGLWDEALVFTAPGKKFGAGIAAPLLPAGPILETAQLDEDTMKRIANPVTGFWATDAAALQVATSVGLRKVPGYF